MHQTNNIGYNVVHFSLTRGIGQGCPLSGLLFIIGIEFLGNAIRNSQEIKGINIEPGKTVKLAQYVDDTSVIAKDDESVISLFELLSQFEKCSGLRINESKSELFPRVAGFIILFLKGLRRDEISCGVYGHVYFFIYFFIYL